MPVTTALSCNALLIIEIQHNAGVEYPPPRGFVVEGLLGWSSDEGVALINLWPGPGSVVIVMSVNVHSSNISSKLVFFGIWGPEYVHCHLGF